MPNHIKNRIEIIGTPEQVKQVFEKYSTFYPSVPGESYDGCIRYKRSEYDFGFLNKETNIFSRRDEADVIGVPEGYEVDMESEWTRFPDFNKALPMPKIIENSMLPESKSEEWYKWSINNWGTKWNSYQCEKKSENVFMFDTAWSSVPKILEEISLNFPEVEFLYEYSDEDTGCNCGIIKLKNGIVDKNILPNNSNEAYELAFKLRPNYKEDYQLVDGKYKNSEEIN